MHNWGKEYKYDACDDLHENHVALLGLADGSHR